MDAHTANVEDIIVNRYAMTENLDYENDLINEKWQFRTIEVCPVDENDSIGKLYEKGRKHDKKLGTFYPCAHHVYIKPREGDTRWLIRYKVKVPTNTLITNDKDT